MVKTGFVMHEPLTYHIFYSSANLPQLTNISRTVFPHRSAQQSALDSAKSGVVSQRGGPLIQKHTDASISHFAFFKVAYT